MLIKIQNPWYAIIPLAHYHHHPYLAQRDHRFLCMTVFQSLYKDLSRARVIVISSSAVTICRFLRHLQRHLQHLPSSSTSVILHGHFEPLCSLSLFLSRSKIYDSITRPMMWKEGYVINPKQPGANFAPHNV